MSSVNVYRSCTLIAVVFSVVVLCAGVDYGKFCDHDDDCHDFRLVCSKASNACVCSNFFNWNETYNTCILNATELKEFLALKADGRDMETVEQLNREAVSTFNKLGFAGLLALSLGLLGASCCVIMFCVVDRKSNYAELEETTVTKPRNNQASDTPGPSILPAEMVAEPFDMAF
ncbi:Hypothetical protein NTJ_12405 [Nesidiocoris tenuis]|uniref:Uncharacterized protein n=1 Tax=Nesidiocoris tenuis TaxID=355587 RepID=A0ABN7B5Q2_9HEMI|nr:Hypothetical protein NTJ_12405 [Nesidiocoris tenuis]